VQSQHSGQLFAAPTWHTHSPLANLEGQVLGESGLSVLLLDELALELAELELLDCDELSQTQNDRSHKPFWH
jgi:hypothetical protein